MSGLFGFCSQIDRSDIEAILAHMGQAMRHQPYFIVESKAIHPKVGIGRVGIGIFNRQPQPAQDPERAVALWLCGEFYHQDQRRAEWVRGGLLHPEADDAAYALQVYIREGAAGLARLEGQFVIAVWDGRVEELILVNDRFGIYPHYYTHRRGQLVFAPEIKGVLSAPRIPARLSPVAIVQFVRFQQLLGDRTWFEDIRLLPAAIVLRYRPAEDRLILERYWDWDAIQRCECISFEEAVEEAIRLFQRSVDARIQGPYRVGVYLSGGMDSRMILGFIGRKVPVTTITFGQARCRDVVYAREIARRAGSDHHWFEFKDGRWVLDYVDLHMALTEGMHSWIHMHGIHTLQAAREWIDVALSGWDGGTVFRGILISYGRDPFYRHAPTEVDLLQRLYEAFCQRFTWPGLTEAEAASLFRCRPEWRGLAFDSLWEELARTAHYPPDRRVDYFYIQQVDRRQFQNQIVFPRSAFEVRCPFFDYGLIDFIYSLPPSIRNGPALTRAVLTRRAPLLALVPYEGDDRLPHAHLYALSALWQRGRSWINRHLGPLFPELLTLYADYEEYLRTDLRAWAEDLLFGPQVLSRDLFDEETVRGLWRRHLSGQELWTIGKIAPLMNIELVLRHFSRFNLEL